MTLRTSFLVMASIITLFMSCSVKEPRGNCPCRLTVDLSDASEEYTDVLVSAFDKDRQAVYCCETIDVIQEKLFIEMQKSRIKVICLQGIAVGRMDGRNVFIDEGHEADRLMVSTDDVDCTGETAFSKASFHKNWAELTIAYANPDNSEYPFTLEITGQVNGLGLDTMTPVAGPFRCTGRQQPGENTFKVNLPRQSPEGNGLVMRLIRKTDKSLEKEYDLSEFINSSGYDWTAMDLDDIRIGIDYAGALTSISVIDWKTGFETMIII